MNVKVSPTGKIAAIVKTVIFSLAQLPRTYYLYANMDIMSNRHLNEARKIEFC